MTEKIRGWLAGLAFRAIALLTLGHISPMLGAGIIVEQDGKILLINRSDGLGYSFPAGIVSYGETIGHCVLREAREETGYTVTITGLVGIYSTPGRDPRFHSVSIAYKGSIVSGSEHCSSEGKPCWREPSEAFGHMAFDCEDILKDYLSGKQHII